MTVYQEKNKAKWTKDGRSWYYQVYYKDLFNNNIRKKSKLYINKKTALEEERKFLNTLNRSSEVPMSFETLINKFLEYKKNKVKITSYYTLVKRIKNFNYFNSIKKIQDFNINHFEKWKEIINNNNYKTTYKNNLYVTLRSILNFAIKNYDMNFLTSIMNKMNNFTNPNEIKEEMQFYSYEEFLKFINEEKEFKYKVYFEILYYCGLRKGEANALNWNDIDFVRNTISINKNVSLKIKGEKYKILPPKTSKSNRTLPIPNILVDDLKQLHKIYSTYMKFDNNWFVFGGIYPLADTTVSEHNKSNAKKANLKQIRIHDFRHSCASLLINNGASIIAVSKYLGHENITTTLNTYTHILKNQFEDIVTNLNNLNKK